MEAGVEIRKEELKICNRGGVYTSGERGCERAEDLKRQKVKNCQQRGGRQGGRRNNRMERSIDLVFIFRFM